MKKSLSIRTFPASNLGLFPVFFGLFLGQVMGGGATHVDTETGRSASANNQTGIGDGVGGLAAGAGILGLIILFIVCGLRSECVNVNRNNRAEDRGDLPGQR